MQARVEAFTDASAIVGYRSRVGAQILQWDGRGDDRDLLVAERPRPGARAAVIPGDAPGCCELVDLTASDQSRGSKRLRHRLVQRLRAIEGDQVAAVGAESAAPQVGKEALTHRRVLRRTVPEAERLFAQLPAQPPSQ